jgi:acyl-CoA reductase-like NAD-dependent aldehyde dehydrogenase/molybdopterin converting factor small subunit
MKVDVVCYGALRNYLPDEPSRQARVELGEGATVEAVVTALGIPGQHVFAVLLNGVETTRSTVLADGDEVTLMPPFSGGATKEQRMTDTLTSFDPRTGQVREEIPVTPVEEVPLIIERARKMAPEWAAIEPSGRARMMREVRHRIHARVDDIVETVSAECGKPRTEALAHDVLPVVTMLFYLEKIADKALRPQRVGRIMGSLAGVKSRVEWRPFGVVGVITPWNYPMSNSFLAFAPALFAGNTVVIKPSEVTPACGELLRELLEPLPPSVATVIQGRGDLGAALVDAPCDKISFIGSPATGRKICAAAAKHLTPVVMELGGKDAALVLEDADIERTAAGVAWGAFFNAGQTCCSIERAYVVDSIADTFQEKLLANVERIKQGDEVGSLTFKPQLEIVSRHVDDAVQKGARVLAGGPNAGRRNENGSLWYAPTVLDNISPDMDVLKEETFGPVLAITRVRDEEEAVRRANEDGVNLTASVWTRDERRAERIGARLRAGSVTLNLHGESAAAPWGPWGGAGESGFGRLNGEVGLREFTIPTHVTSPPIASLGRVWWYPYDEPTQRSLRAMVDVLSAPELRTKVKAVRDLAGNATKAMRTKF